MRPPSGGLGACAGTATDSECDDGNPCTTNTCDAVAGCEQTLDDGAACAAGPTQPVQPPETLPQGIQAGALAHHAVEIEICSNFQTLRGDYEVRLC